KIPAEQSGSSVKSIAVTPSSEARFFMRTANIFMLVPPSGAPVGPPHERGRTTPPAPRCHIGLHIPWQRHLPAGAPATALVQPVARGHHPVWSADTVYQSALTAHFFLAGPPRSYNEVPVQGRPTAH